MSSSYSVAEDPDVGFVACIEGGVLEAQTLLLFESIRRYAGRFRDCSLYALSHARGTQSQKTPGKDWMSWEQPTSTEFSIRNVLNTDLRIGVAAAAHIEETRSHDIW